MRFCLAKYYLKVPLEYLAGPDENKFFEIQKNAILDDAKEGVIASFAVSVDASIEVVEERE